MAKWLLKVLRAILNWPDIHQRPSPEAALRMLGVSSEHLQRVKAAMAADGLEHDDYVREAYARLGGTQRKEVGESIALAARGIKERTSQRGRSVAATLVFVGFLVAAQVALISYGFASGNHYLKGAVKPTVIGLIVIFWGMLPTFGALFPRHRGDEGVEAAQKTAFDWYCEDVNRSTAQRVQLWRLRVAMAIALVWTAVTLIMFLFA